MSFESTVERIGYTLLLDDMLSFFTFALLLALLCTHSSIPDLVIVIEGLECQNDVSEASYVYMRRYLGCRRGQTRKKR